MNSNETKKNSKADHIFTKLDPLDQKDFFSILIKAEDARSVKCIEAVTIASYKPSLYSLSA